MKLTNEQRFFKEINTSFLHFLLKCLRFERSLGLTYFIIIIYD